MLKVLAAAGAPLEGVSPLADFRDPFEAAVDLIDFLPERKRGAVFEYIEMFMKIHNNWNIGENSPSADAAVFCRLDISSEISSIRISADADCLWRDSAKKFLLNYWAAFEATLKIGSSGPNQADSLLTVGQIVFEIVAGILGDPYFPETPETIVSASAALGAKIEEYQDAYEYKRGIERPLLRCLGDFSHSDRTAARAAVAAAGDALMTCVLETLKASQKLFIDTLRSV